MSASDEKPKGRVVFVLDLKPGAGEQFLQAYEGLRYDVAQGVKGHIVDQVCRSPEDPDRWLITSEWESLEDFLTWEATDEHRELAKPLRECIEKGTSLKYEVVEETRGGESG